MVKAACGASKPKGRESIPRIPSPDPSPLSSHKVSWLKSERKGLGKVVLWCSKPKGRGSIPGWAGSSFTLVSEWKKPIR